MFEESVANFDLGGKLLVPDELGVIRECDDDLNYAIDEYCHFGPSGVQDSPELFPIESILADRSVLVAQKVLLDRAYLEERFPQGLQRVTHESVHVALLPHSEYDPENYTSQCVLASTKDQLPRMGYTYLIKRNQRNVESCLGVIEYYSSRLERFLDERSYGYLLTRVHGLKLSVESGEGVFESLASLKMHIQVQSASKREDRLWLEELQALVTDLYFSIPENERALIRYARGTWVFFKDEEFLHGRIPMGFDPVGGDLSYFSFKQSKPA